MNKITVNGYERITIKKALKIYLTGEPVYVVPSKVRIGSGWFEYPFSLLRSQSEPYIADGESLISDFYKQITRYQYYNCNSELGRYPAYYKKAV